MKLASRMERIGTETAFEAAARARALEATGRDVIHLEIGEPDFDTPRHIREAAARGVLDEGLTHYTAATGIAPLREAIAADVKRWKGIDATPDQVVVTPGAKPIMYYAILALVTRPRLLAIAIGALVLTLPFVPWQLYLADGLGISVHLGTAWNGSAARLPILIPVVVLALWILRRQGAEWLLVPALWYAGGFTAQAVGTPPRTPRGGRRACTSQSAYAAAVGRGAWFGLATA